MFLGSGFTPIVANAQGSNICIAANNQCTGTKDKGKPCFCAIVGAYITGVCLAVPNDCKALTWFVNAGPGVSASNGVAVSSLTPSELSAIGLGEQSGIFGQIGAFIKDNPLISGLGMGVGMSLLQSLMSPSGSSESSTDSGTYSSGYCTTQYYYTSNTSALTDPCALYSADVGTSGTQTGSTSDSLSDLLKNLNSSNSPGITIPSTTAGSISPYLPIAAIDTSGTLAGSEPTITVAGDTGALTPVPVSDLLASNQFYTDNTSASTPSAAQTPLNQNPVPVPINGLRGDIKSLGSGATIYASSRSGNTEISGFYGSTAGGTPQSAAGKMCKSRPWSSNFLSYVIPSSFFDNLCSWGGYKVGTVQATGSGGGDGTSTGGGSNKTSIPAPKSETIYSNPVVAQAKIWARPASVSIGGRTTVFWTSANVTSCIESSSDGNFSGQSTSGGASTVPLSGATTFNIQCQTIDGKTISDSTTVQIGI
ncbi:MAG TPA: hypothetical protein VJG64_03580 [Candidatus Paceibacterota bacterium]